MAFEHPPAELVAEIGPYIRQFLSIVDQALEPASTYLGTVLTSWYRTPAHNQAVGGAARSQHQLGLALDFVFPSPSSREAAKRSLRLMGLVVFDEGDHVHVQAYNAGQLTDDVFRRLGVPV